MRPKKVVLFVSANKQRLSCLAFVLETRGFRVLRAQDAREAIDVMVASGFGYSCLELLVTEYELPLVDGDRLTQLAKELYPDLPVLLMSYTLLGFDQPHSADFFLPKGCTDAATVVERVRILTARKRGPKKQLTPPVFLPATEERVVA